METIKELLNKLKTWQKITFAAVLVLLIGSVFFFANAKPKQEVLYSNLTPSDSKSIMKELSQMGIDFTSQDDGATLYIDGENKSSARMKLAVLGLPSEGNPGLNRLDEMKLGETKYDKQRRFERAIREQIENDLVMGFDGINSASVALSINQGDRLFEEDASSKATVSLAIQKGSSLNESQIQGIQNFVSANIENMEPGNVVVLDDKGNILSMDMDSDIGSVAGYAKQSQILVETEKRIKDDIMKSLSSIFGYDHVRVNVRADVNFDEIVQNIEKYDPEGTLISNQKNKHQIAKTDGETSIVPGTEVNGEVPEYEIEDVTGDANYLEKKEEIIENFEVGKTIETIKKNPELTNLNVVAWIDKMMTEQEVAVMQKAVAVAAGITGENENGTFNNGSVEIIPVIFNQNMVGEQTDEIPTADAAESKKMTVWLFVLLGAGFVLVALFIWLNLRKKEEMFRLEEELETMDDRVSLSSDAAEEEGVEFGGSLANGANLMDSLSEGKSSKDSMLFSEEEMTDQQRILSDEARKAAEDHPERTADYLKKLINEG